MKTSDKATQERLYNKMVDKRTEPSTLNIQAEHLPDIKDWDVGKVYEIKLKAKMISKSEGGWDGKQPLSASFQIGEHQDDGECCCMECC